MATTPYFIWPRQASSTAADVAGFGFGGAPEDQAAAALVSPEFSASTVARPRLRRQSSSGNGTGKQQQQQVVAGGGGAPKKPPQRGLGVAELERLRCGGDPLRDLSVAAAAMGDAASVHGNSVILHHHLPPAFDATTAGSRYYSPLLVQPHPATLAPPAPVCYVHSHPAGGQSVAPEQPFMDCWGRLEGFAPAGNAGPVHQNLLLAPAPEHPSSQSTVWRPASSSASCLLHTGHRCDLCSKTTRALTERGSRVPATAAAATATTNMPDYSIYDLAAAMAAARKDTGEGLLAREGKKEVREIEFFPTSTNQHAGGAVGPDESEFATARWTPFSASSSSGAGGCTAPLDLSLKL